MTKYWDFEQFPIAMFDKSLDNVTLLSGFSLEQFIFVMLIKSFLIGFEVTFEQQFWATLELLLVWEIFLVINEQFSFAMFDKLLIFVTFGISIVIFEQQSGAKLELSLFLEIFVTIWDFFSKSGTFSVGIFSIVTA